MPFIKFGPDGSFSFGLSMEDVEYWVRRLSIKDKKFLSYDAEALASFYGKGANNWMNLRSPKGPVLAPYSIVVDYRKRDKARDWGKIRVQEPYQFPSDLMDHRKCMVGLFMKAGRLYKGDKPCPRISHIRGKLGSELTYLVQLSSYFDQVGSNLSLDYPLKNRIAVRRREYGSVREWDKFHSSRKSSVPTLRESQLANTIGIAVGVTALDGAGNQHILMRRRTKRVAVYQNQWSTPFGFALEWPPTIRPGDVLSLREFISQDWGNELAQELNIDASDFEEPMLLAFTRDWIRGGKPQFFFHLRSKLTFSDFVEQAGSDPKEYHKGIDTLKNMNCISPELLAIALLLSKK